MQERLFIGDTLSHRQRSVRNTITETIKYQAYQLSVSNKDLIPVEGCESS